MQTYDPLSITFPCYAQPKLNGVNCTLRTDGILVSRTGKYFPAVQKAFNWPRPQMELYGELYRHEWSLQKILGAVTPDEPTEDTRQLHFDIFDVSLPDDFETKMRIKRVDWAKNLVRP